MLVLLSACDPAAREPMTVTQTVFIAPPHVATVDATEAHEEVRDPLATCEDVTIPAVHSVTTATSEQMTRALHPLIRALCVCTHDGDEVHVFAKITPSEGRMTAEFDSAPAVVQCMHSTFAARFEPFALSSDCIACTPHRYDVFHGPAPVPLPAAILMYPMTFVHAPDNQSP